MRHFAEWVRAKFDIPLNVDQLKDLKAEQIQELLLEQTEDKYRRREIEYPVEFAMSMAFGPQDANVYGFEALAEWANPSTTPACPPSDAGYQAPGRAPAAAPAQRELQ